MYLSKNKQSKFWQLHYKNPRDGKSNKITTKCISKTDAYQFLLKFNKEDIVEKKEIEKIQLKKAIKEYKLYSMKVHTYKSHKGFITTFNFFLRYFPSSTKVISLNSGKLENYITFRRSSSSVYQARKDFINLSSFFSWMVNQRYISINPFSSFKQPRIPKKQPKFLNENEYQLLSNSISDKNFKGLVEFALNTGLRSGEIANLQWAEVDFENSTILITTKDLFTTKNKDFRVIPMNKKVRKILTSLDKSNEYVFLNNFGNKFTVDLISRQFKKYVIDSGINSKFHFHCIRHTTASWLVQKGAPLYSVSKLLGHKDIKTTQIYASLSNKELERIVEMV